MSGAFDSALEYLFVASSLCFLDSLSNPGPATSQSIAWQVVQAFFFAISGMSVAKTLFVTIRPAAATMPNNDRLHNVIASPFNSGKR